MSRCRQSKLFIFDKAERQAAWWKMPQPVPHLVSNTCMTAQQEKGRRSGRRAFSGTLRQKAYRTVLERLNGKRKTGAHRPRNEFEAIPSEIHPEVRNRVSRRNTCKESKFASLQHMSACHQFSRADVMHLETDEPQMTRSRTRGKCGFPKYFMARH